MPKFKKFYDLLPKNANVTLTTVKHHLVYFKGKVKDIPDRFDNCAVADFSVINSGEIIFEILT